jgi:hypothetical protein
VVGLAGPLFTFAVIALGMLFVVWRYLPDRKPDPEARGRAGRWWAGRRKERPMWRDPRITPFLIYGFITATCQTAQQQSPGLPDHRQGPADADPGAVVHRHRR